MRALSKYQDVKDDMPSVIKNQIKSEMCELSKNLLHFDSHKLSSVLKDRAPYLFDILNCIVKKKHFITTAASVLLYGHSQRLCQLQYIVGLSLDRCGLTKEVRN